MRYYPNANTAKSMHVITKMYSQFDVLLKCFSNPLTQKRSQQSLSLSKQHDILGNEQNTFVPFSAF